jgi:Putative Flp pilus-assembly TadE/G-like
MWGHASRFVVSLCQGSQGKRRRDHRDHNGPIIFLLGMTLDFTQALRKKEQLDAAADAAAIAAVRPAMLMQSDTVAKDTATAIFMSVANSLPGLVAVPTPTDHHHRRRASAHC